MKWKPRTTIFLLLVVGLTATLMFHLGVLYATHLSGPPSVEKNFTQHQDELLSRADLRRQASRYVDSQDDAGSEKKDQDLILQTKVSRISTRVATATHTRTSAAAPLSTTAVKTLPRTVVVHQGGKKVPKLVKPCPPHHVCRNGRAYRLHPQTDKERPQPPPPPPLKKQKQLPPPPPPPSQQYQSELMKNRDKLHERDQNKLQVKDVPQTIFERFDKFKNDPVNINRVDPSSVAFKQLQALSRRTHILTMLSDPYIRGHVVFLRSMKLFNPWFDSPLLVLDLGLSESCKEKCLSAWPNTKFITPKVANYDMAKITKERNKHANLKQCYYKMDVFTMTQCDRILSIDTGDMLVVGDLSELFKDRSFSFGAVPASLSQKYSKYYGHKYFNAGLLVIGHDVISKKTYHDLIHLAETMPAPPASARLDNHNDQDVLNQFFQEPRLRLLDKKYNVEKRSWDKGSPWHHLDFEDARIIHFVGGKPWQLINRTHVDYGYNLLEGYWWDLASQQSTLVIGNAPSVLESEAGHIIDRFPNVIRLTNFQLKGFELYVGTKTDDIFITFATKPANYSIVPQDRIHLFAGEHWGDLEWLNERIMKPNGPQVDVHKISILEDKYFSALNRELGLVGKERASTGVIAMKWVLNNRPDDQIFTYGIEFFKGMGGKLKHYTQHVSKRDGYHSFTKEEAYFVKYYDTLKIQKLVVEAP